MKSPISLFFLSVSFIFVAACNPPKKMSDKTTTTPPIADRQHYQIKTHGDIRVDPYYWLRERDNPEVIDYLERENAYFDAMTTAQEPLRKELCQEMRSRIKEDDTTVPYFYNGYWYITRYETGKDYPIYTRKKDSLTAAEEILFDCNAMAKDMEYFRLVGISVSPDNTKVAFGLDTVSRRQYTLYIKDLTTGKLLDTKIKNTTGSSAWAADDQHLFYTLKDPQTLRSAAIYRHDLSAPKTPDTLVFEEKDETFSVSISTSKSEDYLFISSYSTLTSEQQFLKRDDPKGSFTVLQARERGLEYYAEHMGEHFYILTNKDKAQNYKLMRTAVSTPAQEHWEPFLAHRSEVLLQDLELFKDYWVVSEREQGLTRIRVVSWDGAEDYFLPFDGETYSASIGFNPTFDTTELRYFFNSLRTPATVYAFDMATQKQRQLKQQTVLGEFSVEDYVEKRIWATARDGAKVPISIIHHKNTMPCKETPILLYAYGSYGSITNPRFSSTRLSLLNRGFIFAIAHIRGGQYLGRHWYEDGKLFKKKNTFYDYIDASKHLIAEAYTAADHLYAMGGSAGGLLMGAVVNMAPELYNGVVAAVPFVDVVTTMLDDDIPLTTSEYDEWGNPNKKDFYNYMLSYSPYDQVRAQQYPNMLVTTGYHDSQVQYWEPAKWVAKLRVSKTDANVLLFHTNMEAGHGGASGRFEALKEIAREYAFFLALESAAKSK